MNEQMRTTPEAVPYIVFEGELARQERYVRRLWMALIISIVCIVLVVGTFVWYLNQYDFMSYEQDGEGVNIIGDRNGVGFNVPDFDDSASADEGEEESFVSTWSGNP